MIIVKEIIAHILFHVNAEVPDPLDEDQVAGVEERAQYVRDTLRTLTTNSSQKSEGEIIQMISDKTKTDSKQDTFKRALANIEQKPQLAIQDWVGKNREKPDG